MNTDILQKTDLFENLDDRELTMIARISVASAYSAGYKIFEEGRQAKKLYIIESGSVRITKYIEDAGDELLIVINAGDYFGEMALIDDSPRSATATAISETTLIEIDKKDLRELMTFRENLANKLLWKFARILSRRLRELHDKFEGLFAITRLY